MFLSREVFIGHKLVPRDIDPSGGVNRFLIDILTVGVIRVAAALDREAGNVVDGVGLVPGIQHILHPDTRYQTIFHEKADAIGIGILGLIGVKVIVRCEKVTSIFLDAVY